MSKFLYAAAAGFIVGLIVAPDKGSRTRAKLAVLLDDAASDSVVYIEEAADRVQGVADTLQDQLVGHVNEPYTKTERGF